VLNLYNKRITQVFESAKELPFDDSSKIIIMSDCHRGDGSWADDFSKNQNLFFAALSYYYDNNYTYIELGDGDELWENNITDIIREHSDVFWILSKFYKEGRFYSLYGNHDMLKKDKKYVKENFNNYYDEVKKKYVPLFENINIHEGLILKHKITNNKIFLLHGHQVDFFNDKLWRLSGFLIKYFWKPLELFGVNDPTRPAKNFKKKENVARNLTKWIAEKNQMLIAGHTHRSVFPEVGQQPYFNDGSSVHPRCITGIEISDGFIALIKWYIHTKKDGILFVNKAVLAGPVKLNEFFNKKI
jgi:UDP-2,3-diacylglucosamine pyrophosphatase LpxH